MTGKQASMINHILKGYIKLEKRMTAMKVTGSKKVAELKGALAKEQQVSSGFLMAGDEVLRFPSPKLEKAMEIIDSYPESEQFIVWTYFQETTVRMANAIKNSASIYGKTSNAQRKKNIADFKAGKLRVLVMQITSGNTGLNLQMCTKQIFVEYDFTPANIDQAIARSARSGQTNTVTVWALYTLQTADEVSIKTIRDKKKVTSAIMSTYITRKLKKLHSGSIKGIV